MLTKEEKQSIMKEFSTHDGDTGSPEVQIALLSRRIERVTEHMKIHSKDLHSRYGLMKMVGRRRKLLDYLKDTDIKRYRTIVKKLKLRG